MDSAEIAWRTHALCKPRVGATPDEVAANVAIFFSHPDEAKKVCARCPSQRPCLAWAMDHDYRAEMAGEERMYGVWGGMTKGERWADMNRWTR